MSDFATNTSNIATITDTQFQAGFGSCGGGGAGMVADSAHLNAVLQRFCQTFVQTIVSADNLIAVDATNAGAPALTVQIAPLGQALAAEATFITAAGAALAADGDFISAVCTAIAADAACVAGIGTAIAGDAGVVNLVTDAIAADAANVTTLGDALAADANFVTTVIGNALGDAALVTAIGAAIAADAATITALNAALQNNVITNVELQGTNLVFTGVGTGFDGTIDLSALAGGGAGLVPSARQITGGGLATGGGDLSADRVINVPAASDAQALALTATNVALTPANMAAILDAYIPRVGTFTATFPTSVNITFATPFPAGSTPRVVVTPLGNVNDGDEDDETWRVFNVSNTGFSVQTFDDGNFSTFNYVAAVAAP